MGNNNSISNNEDIQIKVDQNNLIYIDPNSVVDSDGTVKPRNLQAENLVMYVNLEADLVSRSLLSSTNDTNTLTSVASGTLNFLRNNKGDDYDSKWTDTFINQPDTQDKKGNFFQSDTTGQSFGIDSVSIQIKGFNAIPSINIKFIDIRGKTLFETPENSPYKAFFHMPWPIFYLTVKGFYGKAIKYRLHLVKFTSKFNETNGNFEIDTAFVGSTYAWLSDIPLQGIMNAPYLYPNESSSVGNTNTSTGQQNSNVVKSTKGYELLRTVYAEYKAKGLIAPDFPVKTLREVITISNTLDTLLEKQIFDQVVDMRIFAGIKEFDTNINNFTSAIQGWGTSNLDKTAPDATLTIPALTTGGSPTSFYNLKEDKTKDTKIKGDAQGTLEQLINLYTSDPDGLLTKNQVFNNNLINNTKSNFNKTNIIISKMKPVDDYVKINSQGQYGINIQGILDDINQISKDFDEQRVKLESDIEDKMNQIVLDKNKGFGFPPTIRNLFAIILANAEVLIRLMKDVHKRAFDQGNNRKRIVGNYSNETVGEYIYPWPELKAKVNDKENTIIYPGDPDFQQKLGSNDATLWPEVEFLETYIGISTNKVDPLANQEGGVGKIPTITQNNNDVKNIKKISTANSISNILPYVNKEPSSIVYEIWERALNYTLIDSFTDSAIIELAGIEYENLTKSIETDNSLIRLIHDGIKSLTDFPLLLRKVAPYENYTYYEDQLPTTDYLKSFYGQSFNIEQYVANSNSSDVSSYSSLINCINNYVPEPYRTNIYPFSSDLYIGYVGDDRNDYINVNKGYLSNGKFLEVDTTQGLISGQKDPMFWVADGGKNSFYAKNLFSRPVLVNDNATLILNTPYFHNQLYNDFNNPTLKGRYAGSAYLLLNSLPFVELSDYPLYQLKDKTATNVLVSSLFREIGSSQYVPYHLMLKWGSIYHRYKTFKTTGVDILTGFTTSNTNTTTKPISGRTFFDNGNDSVPPLFINGKPITYTIGKDVGIHPYYDAIFHQVVNGYEHFNYTTNYSTDFENKITNGNIIVSSNTLGNSNKTNYWTQFVDNSKYVDTDLRYTLLPSIGGNLYAGYKQNGTDTPLSDLSFESETQNGFRIIWEDEYVNGNYSGVTFNRPNEYFSISLDDNYMKVMDLIATFNSDILDEFESYFINFASEKLNLSVDDSPFPNVQYNKFQDLLKKIVSQPKFFQGQVDQNIKTEINKIKQNQSVLLKLITKNILSTSNLIKITLGNPKEIDPHVFNGFAQIDSVNRFTYDSYVESDFIQNLMDLYLGEEPETGCYKNFFINNDVKFSEQNLIIFRSLILIYAGYVRAGNPTDKSSFQDYIKTNVYLNTSVDPFGTNKVNGAKSRKDLFLNTMINLWSKNYIPKVEPSRITFFDGYNNKPLKAVSYTHLTLPTNREV